MNLDPIAIVVTIVVVGVAGYVLSRFVAWLTDDAFTLGSAPAPPQPHE